MIVRATKGKFFQIYLSYLGDTLLLSSEEEGDIDFYQCILQELVYIRTAKESHRIIMSDGDYSILLEEISSKSSSGGGGGEVDPSVLEKKEDKRNKVSAIGEDNKDNSVLYPSIKAVHDFVKNSSSGVVVEEVSVSVSNDVDSIPFSVTKGSSSLLGNPDSWVDIGGYLVPSYDKSRLEG